MPLQWIITDIDGCLSDEKSVPFALDSLVKLARLTRASADGKGPIAPMTLCTGRPQPYAEALMKLLDIRAPAVCENGAVLYSLHDNAARWGPGVTAEKIRGLRAVRTYIETELLPARPAAVLQFGKEAQISVFSRQTELFAPMKLAIQEFVTARGGPDLQIDASHYYLNISLAGVNKGAALAALLEQLGVSRDEIAGIGDTVGDIPLRETVGYFACPANSQPAVKAVADYVSPYPMLDGVLDILSRPPFRRD